MKKLLSVLLIAALLAAMLPYALADKEQTASVAVPQNAASDKLSDNKADNTKEKSQKSEQILEKIIAKPETPENKVKIYVDGVLRERGLSYENELFISIEALERIYPIELVCEKDESGNKLSVTCEGLVLEIDNTKAFAVANNRYLFCKGGFVEEKGRVYVQADMIASALSVRCELVDGSIYLRSDKVCFIEDGEEYYKANFNPTDVYWLSRLIYAEAMNQPMETLIAVGNVVLNRVNDTRHYPNNVKDVVFDNVPVVQFDVTETGAINLRPDENSLVAAYLALDGVNTAKNSRFFVNPDKCDASWFETELNYVCTCGLLDFYTEDEVADGA